MTIHYSGNIQGGRPVQQAYVPSKEESVHAMCRMCHRVLPLAMFARNKYRPDGFEPYCKPCFKAVKNKGRRQ